MLTKRKLEKRIKELECQVAEHQAKLEEVAQLLNKVADTMMGMQEEIDTVKNRPEVLL